MVAHATLGKTGDAKRGKPGRPAQVVAASCLLLIAGCGGTTSSPVSGEVNPVDPNVDSSKVLVASGFGQQSRYAWATALVRNVSDNVGQTVKVHFTLFDAAGRKLAVASEAQSFAVPRQQLAIGHYFQVPGGRKAARVEAAVSVEDTGAFDGQPRPPIPTGPVVIRSDRSGGHLAYVRVTNPSSDPLKFPTIGVICYGAGNRVVGGGVSEPPLVPPSGSLITNASVIASGASPRCDAYASYRE